MSEPYYEPLKLTPYPDRRFLGNFISQDSFLLALHASWKDLSYDEIVDVFNEAMDWCYNGGGHPENGFDSVEKALENLQRSLGEICYYCNGSAKTGKVLASGWALTELGCKRVFRKACVYCIHAPLRVIRTKLMGNKTFGVCRLCGNYRSGKTVTELSCGIARSAEKAPKEGTSTYHLCFSCKKH